MSPDRKSRRQFCQNFFAAMCAATAARAETKLVFLKACERNIDPWSVEPFVKPRVKHRVALSLHVLQIKLAAGDLDPQLPVPITRVHGLTRGLDGEIILRGVEEEADGGVFPICPDDIVLAMRTMLLSDQPPGVSIDPVLASDGHNIEPQQRVIYFGNIAGTRAGALTFECDYWMKKAALGHVVVPVGGFHPYIDYVCATLLREASPVRQSIGARFWFYPKEYVFRVSKDHRAMELDGGGVELLTEKSHLARRGGRATFAGDADPPAHAFAHNMTQSYDHIGRAYKPLLQMKNFIDLCATFKWLDRQRPALEAWRHLLFDYQTVAAYTPDVASTLSAPIRGAPGVFLVGGVSIEIRSAHPYVVDVSARLVETFDLTLASRSSPTTLFWYF